MNTNGRVIHQSTEYTVQRNLKIYDISVINFFVIIQRINYVIDYKIFSSWEWLSNELLQSLLRHLFVSALTLGSGEG